MKAYNFKRFGQFKTKTFPHGKRCYICRSFMTRKHWNQSQVVKAKLKKIILDGDVI